MGDFVNFKLAKKLKEKGYPQHIAEDAYIIDNYGEEKYIIGDRLPIPLVPDYMDDVSAPTISQVLKWLREEKGIHVCIALGEFSDWMYDVARIDGHMFCKAEDDFNSYEQATLAGIEYVLDNLI
jgi:hypothetical protein